ncbi:fimbrial protein [Salmonella enterica]|nr:fimbrial protein [Salmonella enterica]EAV0977040.1 fimbrial protein [Salmonella enterica]EBL9938824.1 fimbrial protein [Salmonella enterica]EIU7610239.1 fimbrial protein [Salmonella enterica]EJI4314082.1 fimbrial protein [Salmonella enterica]
MRKQIKRVLLFMFVGGVLMAENVEAVDIAVRVSGNIVIPPCTINKGQPVEIDFGNIPINEISDLQYRRKKTVSVVCSYYQGIPYVKITGSQLNSAGNNVLSTNISNFGIALYQGDGVSVPLRLGNGDNSVGYPVTAGLSGTGMPVGEFTFTAVPYKVGGGELSVGAFSAGANISITYM